MSTKKIFIRPIGGLCNRMRAIDSALSFAKDTGRELTVVWEKTYDFNCDIFQIFNPIQEFKLINIDVESMGGKINHLKNYPKNKIEHSQGYLKNILRKKAIGMYDMVIYNDDLENVSKSIYKENKNICMNQFDEIFKTKINAVKKYEEYDSVFMTSCYRFYGDYNFGIFKPIEKLENIIDNSIENKENLIGVHIRRGDHVKAIENSPFEMFVEKMKKEVELDSKVKFFLATDGLDTKNDLVEIFGDRIVSIDHSAINRDTSAGIETAVLDLYCLSKTKKILGSYYSSFSQVASQIGGIDLIDITSY